ncbi:hypothetical protein D3C85_1360630 [compost metagenome]
MTARTSRTPPVPADIRFQPPEPAASGAPNAWGVDEPKGIRREPKAYEDDAGEARSEGSGPKSLTRAFGAPDAAGVLKTSDCPPRKHHQFKLAPEIFTIS